MGSGAGPGRALRSHRVFRRRSVAATSAAAAALPPPRPSPHVPRPAPRRARRVTRLAASPSHARPAPPPPPAAFLSLSRSIAQKGGAGRVEDLKQNGVGEINSFHPLRQKINQGVLGGAVTARCDDLTASEITRKGARPLGAAAADAPARWWSGSCPPPLADPAGAVPSQSAPSRSPRFCAHPVPGAEGSENAASCAVAFTSFHLPTCRILNG